jgi:hypothetical protein
MLARTWRKGSLIHHSWECKIIPPFWKTIWKFLTKQNTLLFYDPAMVLLVIYQKELKIYVYTKTFTWMFIAPLFIVDKTWKESRFSSAGE